jgi:glycosyltransferase involved in cell wall biosynthesis
MTMRVLHVTHQYYPAIGGSERYITDLSEALARRGHDVDVFTTRSRDFHTWQNELPVFETINGVHVHRFGSWGRGPGAWRMLGHGLRSYAQSRSPLFEPLIFFGNGPVSPPLFWAILRRAHQYDLVHINQLHYAHAWTAYVAARLRKLPIVVTPHIHVEQPQTYDIGYLWRILRGSQAVLAVTGAERAFLQRRLPDQSVIQGGNSRSLAEVPPHELGLSRQRFGLPANAFVLLFLGRKTEYKGLAQVLHAFTTLRRQRSDLYLLAVGPETEYSQQVWQQVGAVEGLVVRGAVSDEERLAALAAADVLVMPSTGEAFGIVYLEAWAYSKPVIGANIQAVQSLIDDGVDGFVVDPALPSQLLGAILTLVDHPQRAAEMGQQGQRKLRQRYRTEHITDVVEATYARVLRRVRTTATLRRK